MNEGLFAQQGTWRENARLDIFQKLKVGFLVDALINKSSLFLSFISF